MTVEIRRVTVLSPQIDVINSAENPLNNKPIIARQAKIPILETKFKMSLLLLIIFIILN